MDDARIKNSKRSNKVITWGALVSTVIMTYSFNIELVLIDICLLRLRFIHLVVLRSLTCTFCLCNNFVCKIYIDKY